MSKAKQPRRFDSCTQMRRQLVTHSTLSLRTGERTEGRQEWVTKPCGVPLFGDAARARGTCDSCASGWTHEHNYPV
jgi:hypothetical protein